MNDTNPALSISGLHTRIERPSAAIEAVSGISLHIDRGETLGLVGESGCGKSMTGMSVMGLLPPGGRVSAGSITLQGKELVGLSDREYQRIRGNDVAMVFQDPMTSLDPTKAIGEQIAEPYRLHRKASRREAMDRAAEMLALVGFARPAERLNAFPHQLSGGLRQRVMIAMALVCEPQVLIADEPTTALDVTVQAQVLRLLHDLKERLGMAMLLITHDMGVVARWADRVSVMYAGKMVERSDTDRIFGATRHPYSQALLGSIPRLDQPRNLRLYSIPGAPPDLSDPPAGCRFADRCSRADDLCRESDPEFRTVDGHSFACHHPVDGPVPADRPLVDSEPAPSNGATNDDEHVAVGEQVLAVDGVVREFSVRNASFLRRSSAKVHAVSGVSLAVAAGQTFGLVGESGCGKSTLARMIVALERPDSGTVRVLGEDLSGLDRSALRRHRRNLQMMFQDPMDSLDPRMRVGAILAEPFAAQNIGTAAERRDWVQELLAEVGLPASAIDRYPHEFSGGQRQRIGLARALALRPEVIVADEPVSALDVSIRSQVLNLMKTLQERHQLTYVVISHDLTVVRYLADTVGVMYLGRLVEVGPTESVYANPVHPYTAGLISAIPEPDPVAERAKGDVGVIGEPPSPIDPPSGCRFRTRCPAAQEVCARIEPELRQFGDGQQAACHFPLRPTVQPSESDELSSTNRPAATGPAPR